MFFILFIERLNAQTYFKEGSNFKNSRVKLIYEANIGGNRPSLSITYPDGFNYFELVMPVCPGDYCWCLRNNNFEDIAYLKIDFSSAKSKMYVKIKYDALLEKQKDKEKIRNYIKMLEGTFVRK